MLTGSNEGIPPLLSLPPKQYFLGKTDDWYQYDKKRVAILENGNSGIPEEWTVSVKVKVDGEKVIWKIFQQEQLKLQ